jgi:hypothetical protein
MEQGSPEWFAARVGCITMSKANILLTKGKGITLENYIIDIASEVASGMPANKIKTFDMERGNTLEPLARRAYESYTGQNVRQIGLGYLDDYKRISASPDGLVSNKGIEIKCPGTKAHMQTIAAGESPKQYKPQMQGGMWIFDLPEWDYVSFCPQFKPMPLYIITMRRDEEMIKEIRDSAHLAVQKVDEYVRMAKMDISTEVQGICDIALHTLDVMMDIEPEIS